MLVVAGGLQRTGSTYMWQMLGDIIEVNGGIVTPRNQNPGHWAHEWANSEDTYLCKTHTYKSSFDEVIDRIKVIMTVRDPRDLVVSYAYLQETTPQNILYRGMFDRVMDNWRIWKEKVPAQQFYIIRYEMLAQWPVAAMIGIWDFLDSTVIYRFLEDSAARWSLQNNRIRSRQRYDFRGREYVYRRLINNGEIGQFKNGSMKLTLEQIRRIEETAKDYIQEYGYTELGDYDEVSDN